MTNIPNPRDVKGVLLPVVSEPWEEECDECNGKGVVIANMTLDENIPDMQPVDCPACDDGTRMVRLVGFVELDKFNYGF